MSDFCIDTIQPAATLRPDNGVLRIDALRVTADASLAAERIVKNARAEADTLLNEARVEAQRMAQDAQGEAQRLTRDLEQQTLQRAEQLLQALEKTNSTFLQRAQDMIVDLAQGLFDRMVMDTTPREKIEAALKRVLHEAPSKLVSPVLRVHPDDVELVPQVEWEIKPDSSMPRGVCRLEASGGQWNADFGAAVEALRSAFTRAVELSNTNTEGT